MIKALWKIEHMDSLGRKKNKKPSTEKISEVSKVA